MSSIRELSSYLESLAPLSLQESYDNSGLLTGQYDWMVKAVLCSLDATEEVVEEAIKLKCNVVVSHHPIIFSGLKRIQGYNYVERAVIKAIKNDIALYAIHTNLDNVLQNGVSYKMAELLDLQQIKILKPIDNQINIGSGVIGDLIKPISPADLLDLLKTRFKTKMLRYTPFKGHSIQKLALAGGSGSFLIREALVHKADALITADVKYHDFFEGDGHLMICDIGHYESEQYTIDLLSKLISDKFSNFATHCTKINTNPVQYF